VIQTKDHNPDAQATIFHNDIRSYSKDFERFYKRAADLPGVEFIRQRLTQGQEVAGYEVDAVVRKVVADACYGEFFVHRTGHNIHHEVQGTGRTSTTWKPGTPGAWSKGCVFPLNPGSTCRVRWQCARKSMCASETARP
jgi:hypothetical protein